MKRTLVLSLVLLTLLVTSLRAQVILQDDFNYANGTTPAVSGGLWAVHSPATPANNSFVNGGRLEVFASRGDDINRAYVGTPSDIIYASFIVNMTNLPTGAGAYFAHFKDNTPSAFRARTWAVTSATPNTWRLAIANGGSPTPAAIVPLDLATNVDYRVVITWDNTTGGTLTAKLWIDPVSESDFNVLGGDSTSAITLTTFAFRQAGGEGSILIDDLYVGNSFNDVNVGAVKPATIYRQPEDPVTMFTGNSKTLYCVAGGAGTVTFQWQKGGVDIADDATHTGTASSAMSIVSATTGDSGNYTCVVTSTTNGVFASSVTSAISHVTVSVALVPPIINPQPANQAVFFGQPATISLGATGPGTITYQWKTNGIDVAGATSPSLVIPSVQPFNGTTNTYRCAVSNEYGGLLSNPATLSATYRPTVSVAYLRTLVDPITYLATNSTTIHAAVGTVTTFTNLTSGNTSSYYLQDSTAGINIFATFASTFRPALGDVVFFTGVLSSFNSTLELLASTAIADTSYFVISNNLASLPAPQVIPFDITNNLAFCETNLEGRVVMLTNVFFGAHAGTAIPTTVNTNITVTNASGETFRVFFSLQDLDTAGQILPDFAWSVIGPMTQDLPNGSNPRNQNYSVTVTRFADIVTAAPPAVSIAISRAGSSATLTWATVPYNYSYSVLAATSVDGVYTPIATGLTFTTVLGSFTDTNAGGSQKYYRVVSP